MSMRDAPLVSVITPFYNTAGFLEECIGSVVEQTYREWEYVLLDNMSDDGSLEIAERWAARDSRIRVIRAQHFVGQVANYNRAIKSMSADAKYCKVVQADDWLFPVCLTEMVRTAEQYPTIGVVGSYSMYRDTIGHVGLPSTSAPRIAGRDACRLYLLRGGFLGSPTCVLYRSDLVRARDPFFDENSPCEDVEAVLELLLCSDFGFVFQVLTGNRRDNEAIWTRIEDFSPVLLHNYLLLKKFAPLVLTAAEHEACRIRAEREYYSALARGLLGGLGEAFWSFHRTGLASHGLGIERMRLYRAVARECVNALADPRRLVRALAKRAHIARGRRS